MAAVCLTLPALLVTAATQESFRLPKLLVSEVLVLVTLILLSFRLWGVQRIEWRSVVRHPALLAAMPFLLVSTSSLWTSEHREHVVPALISLWIATAGLFGWSIGLRREEFPRILRLLAVPSVVLCAVALGQYFDLFEVFHFQDKLKQRIAVTSLAGGAFDLAAYLVLPSLVALTALWQDNRPWWRGLWAAVFGLTTLTIALSQTLSALVVLTVGCFLLLIHWLPTKRLLTVCALGVVLGGGLVFAVEPLRQRLESKVAEVARGDFNNLLSGRLDGWRAALWMAREHPLVGVGHGAYQAEFGHAKIAMRKAGVNFYRRQHQPYFVNAHSEPLEVLANGGGLGMLAFLFAGWQLVRALRRAVGRPEERALMWAGTAAILVMALVNFPFRIALVAYPMLFFFSWIFAAAADPCGEDTVEGAERRGGGTAESSRPGGES